MARAARLQKEKEVVTAAGFDPATPGTPATLRAADTDRDARSFLRLFNMFAMRPLDAYPLALMRQRWRYLALALGRQDFAGHLREVTIGPPATPVRLRIYTPRGPHKLRPAFVWFHGGAFLIGEADTADSICRNICDTAGCTVVAVEYRLAPEHNLFDGRADCVTAMDWLFEHGAEAGIDSEHLAVGGDSAGGNLAAVLAQECQARGRKLKLQVLVYPATNLAETYPSKIENAEGYLLTSDSIDWIRSIVGHEEDQNDIRLSPMFKPDLRGLSPAVVITAGYDPIRDDGLHYTQRLRKAEVPVELLHYAGQFHGFMNFDAVLGGARDALRRIAGALQHAFADETAPNRTVEIADPGSGRDPRFAADAMSDWLTTGFMTGEWLEYQRNRVLKVFWPSLATPVDASKLLNLSATFRRMIATSTLTASETFADANGKRPDSSRSLKR